MVYPYQHNNGYPYAYGAPPYQEPQINASYEQHIPMASNLTSKLSNFAKKFRVYLKQELFDFDNEPDEYAPTICE